MLSGRYSLQLKPDFGVFLFFSVNQKGFCGVILDGLNRRHFDKTFINKYERIFTMTMKVQSEDDVINQVAQQYLNNEEKDLSEEYESLGRYNEKRFEDIPVDVEFTEDDPYSSAEEMWADIENNDRLKIFSGGSSPPGMTEMQNLKGRAVHDYFGHYQNQCDFSLEGEFTKWYNQKSEVPDGTEALYFSEVVGQTALVHYLDDGFGDDRFEQRSVLVDEEVRDEVVNYFTKDL